MGKIVFLMCFCLLGLSVNAAQLNINNDKLELSSDELAKKEKELDFLKNKANLQVKQFEAFKPKNQKNFDEDLAKEKNMYNDRVKQYESLMHVKQR